LIEQVANGPYLAFSFWGQLQPLLMMLLGAVKSGVATFGRKIPKILP
jgi:hypothetical protein